MVEFIVRVGVHLACFGAVLYSMSALNYEKIVRKNKVLQAQVLYLMVAMAISYLAAQFLFNLVAQF